VRELSAMASLFSSLSWDRVSCMAANCYSASAKRRFGKKQKR
jgi:hypothetical protein